VGEPGAPSAVSIRSAEVFQELYDESFAESLADVVNEITAEAGQLVVGETADAVSRSASVQQQLLERYEPVIRAGEAMFESAAADIAQREGMGLGELELEEIFAAHQPEVGSPAFEGLFGGLRRLATKALSAVKTVAAGPLLRMLGKAVRPLIQAAVKYAANKAPAPLRGVIRAIGRKVVGLLGDAPPTVAGEEPVREEEEDYDASAPATELEQAFRGYLTAGLLAPDGTSAEEVTEQFAAEVSGAAEDHLAQLEDARERFVSRLTELNEGESVQPAMEEFVPILMAVRPMLRMAINAIGRDRVVRTIAGRRSVPPRSWAESSSRSGGPAT
jgi:hypothetical protein